MGKNNFDGVVSFTAQALNDKNCDELEEMSILLKKVGFSLEINRKENAGLGISYDHITLKVNKERYQAAISRHAGRKADFNKKYDKYGKCIVAELQEKLRVMKKTEIAQELGCSRMTLYRIIKNISERNPAGDISIWHYTS